MFDIKHEMEVHGEALRKQIEDTLTRGFMLVPNYDIPKSISRHMLAGAYIQIKAYCDKNGRRPPVYITLLRTNTSMLFWFRIPRLKKYAPVEAALNLVAYDLDKNLTPGVRDTWASTTGGMVCRVMSSDREYRGTGRDCLRTAIAIFRQPHIRDILVRG